MLQRATIALNVVAAVTMVITAIYIFVVFHDVVSPAARMIIGLGVFAYSAMQFQVAGKAANKN